MPFRDAEIGSFSNSRKTVKQAGRASMVKKTG